MQHEEELKQLYSILDEIDTLNEHWFTYGRKNPEGIDNEMELFSYTARKNYEALTIVSQIIAQHINEGYDDR